MARAKLFGASGLADHRWSTTPRRLGGGRFRTPVGAREFMELRHCTACPCAISGGCSGFNGTGLVAVYAGLAQCEGDLVVHVVIRGAGGDMHDQSSRSFPRGALHARQQVAIYQLQPVVARRATRDSEHESPAVVCPTLGYDLQVHAAPGKWRRENGSAYPNRP